MTRSRLKEGSPYPCGATWTGIGVNFAVRDWVRLLDTNLPYEDAGSNAPTRFRFGHKYGVDWPLASTFCPPANATHFPLTCAAGSDGT